MSLFRRRIMMAAADRQYIEITINKLSNPVNNSIPVYVYDRANCNGVYIKNTNGDYQLINLSANSVSGYTDSTIAYYSMSAGDSITFYVDVTGFSGNMLIGKYTGGIPYGDGSFYYSHVIVPKCIKSLQCTYNGATISSLQCYYTLDRTFECIIDLSNSGITNIPTDTFNARWDNSDIKLTLILPNNLKSIAKYAFRYATLESITIPPTCTSIGDYAFDYCGRLSTVVAHNNITSMGREAFNLSKWWSNNRSNGSLVILNNWLLGIYYSTTPTATTVDITIPSAVTHIAQYSFQNNTKLRYIKDTAGNFGYDAYYLNITYVGAHAFEGCSQLWLGSLFPIGCKISINYIGDYAFAGTGIEGNHNKKLTDNSYAKYLGTSDSKCHIYFSNYEEDSTIYIGQYAFYGCVNLQEAHFCSAAIIYPGAFGDCVELCFIKYNEGCCPSISPGTFGLSGSTTYGAVAGSISIFSKFHLHYNKFYYYEEDYYNLMGDSTYYDQLFDPDLGRFELLLVEDDSSDSPSSSTTTTDSPSSSTTTSP